MSQHNLHNQQSRRRRRGLSLVEVVFATMLVGVVLVGAMDLLGSVIRGRTSTADAAQAEQLAQQLMVEILNTAYQDDTLPLFGPELDETLGLRSTYDDVDDYHNWSPPSLLGLDDNPVVNSTGWQREVTVEWVNPANPALTSLTDLGLKRITVTVKHDGQVVTRLVALRSDKYSAE
jgi:type II secretory pathway pseudopilin PulG